MPQFFIKSSDISDKRCKITGNDFHHMVNVRRIRLNDVINLRNDDGASIKARVVRITDSFIEAEIFERIEMSKLPIFLTLSVCLLKGKIIDFVIEKAVEIGASRIIPVVSERTVQNPSEASSKVKRWKRKALEAAKQSMRETIPLVEDIHLFDELINKDLEGIKIIAHPGSRIRIKDFLRKNRSDRVNLLIGPEGGFSSREIIEAVRAGWIQLNFGFSQLKAGTAATVLPAIIIYELCRELEDKG